MAEYAIEALPPYPADWQIVEMWGFVNAVDDARTAGRLLNNHSVLAVRAEQGARPVRLCFSRPALVAIHGWSWKNHYHDEQVEIVFEPDAVVVHMCVSANKILISRAIVVLATMRCFANFDHGAGMIISCSLGDSDGDEPVLSFSSKSFDEYLIPDPYFMLTRSYEQERAAFQDSWIDFRDRDQRMYWRGAPSGLAKYASQLDSQRVKLVLLANHPDCNQNFNARFSNEKGLSDEVCASIRAVDGFSSPEDQKEIARYAFNLDVDGVSSSWTGFFLKLLAGGTVVKIASDAGYRQWYYNGLRPWVHFAEVAADLSDFGTIQQILTIRRDWAEAIASSGREFALSLDLAGQLAGTIKAVENALASPHARRTL